MAAQAARMRIEERLEKLKIALAPVRAPTANYVQAKRVGDLLYLAGNDPLYPDGRLARGKLGADMSVEEGYRHARQVGLVLIAAMKEALAGDLERVVAIVRVLGMVNAAPGFEDHSAVVDGCSDLFLEVFGERGRHARSAIGMSSLPAGIPVEIEAAVAVR